MNTDTGPIVKYVRHASFVADIDLGLPDAGRFPAQYPRQFIVVGGAMAVLQADGSSVTFDAGALASALVLCGATKILASGTTASVIYAGY